MRCFRNALVAALGLLSSPAAGQSTPTPSDPNLAQAIKRGTLLYSYDQAAWQSTDDFRGRDEALARKSCGWIVTGPAEAAELAFVDCTYKSAVYRARFKNGKLASSNLVTGTDKAPLTEVERQMLVAPDRGLEAFTKAKSVICSRARPNFVVLPPEVPGQPALVYLLTPQSDLKTLPLGGHHRVEVRADGSTGELRAFTKSCLNLSRPAKGAVGLFVTHLLDPVPTEIHVFSSLVAKVPLFVGTQDRKVWIVNGSRVGLSDDKKN